MITRETFEKLFAGHRATRMMHDALGAEWLKPGQGDGHGTLEAHTKFYVFRYVDGDGVECTSRGDYRNVFEDDDHMGFRVPFTASFDGALGFHYSLADRN